jgi:hypothetical protein
MEQLPQRSPASLPRIQSQRWHGVMTNLNKNSDDLGGSSASDRTRSVRDIVEFAHSTVRKRLLNRVSRTVDELMAQVGVPDEMRTGVHVLVRQFEVQLKIPFARINPDETLGDAFRVSREELGMTGSSDWARHGFGDYIETFSYEILHVLEKSISRTEWRKGWERLGRPKDEEILLDTIMAMQLRNFLLFFGSMKPTS